MQALRTARETQRRERGFTLIEMLIVVAIVAILAKIAFPYYGYHVVRSHITEAVSTLSTYRVKLEQYYQDNGNYGTGGLCGVTSAMAAPGTVYFNYACTASSSTGGATDDGYTITATGNAGQGMTGFVYTVDQLNNRSSAITASGWKNPTPNNCWATRKDGTC
jgi:type IV pilus assembly protein PilE